MNRVVSIPALLLSCATILWGQAPAAGSGAAAPRTFANPLGFSYTVPGDWDVVDNSANLADVKQKAAQSASSEDEKKGVACVQMGLTARHGNTGSVIVEVVLPFDCFGQRMSDADLPGFASGASEGVKQNFDIGEPVFGAYALGSHNLWIERAQGTPKGHADTPYTIEITCALLAKAAVCWMGMASDDASLAAFEHGTVTLDGEPPVALVPATAFQKKPS